MKKRILVVDDAPSVRMLIDLSLSRLGYEVVLAEDGKHALDIIEREAFFDLVITDYHMPVCDGLSFLRQLRSEGPSRFVPVIIFLNPLEPWLRKKARRAGVSAWIEKPFKPEALQKLVARFTAFSGD